MERSHFFAMLSRMKYINRWGLMNNTRNENISEHSLQTAMFAHVLAVIKNKRYGGNVNAEKAALLALYHDAAEIITGDMPTPVKYHNPRIQEAYKQVETIACDKLLSYLPGDLQGEYAGLLFDEDEEMKTLVKAADKLSALVKCIEEIRMGNDEFKKAKETTEAALKAIKLPELRDFEREFLPSFYLTLDEQETF